jgi:hypothetical protein
MTCIYNVNCQQCGMYEKDSHEGLNYSNSEFGFSIENDGACAVDEDPKPSDTCSMYEPIDSSGDECECEALGSQCDACDSYENQ